MYLFLCLLLYLPSISVAAEKPISVAFVVPAEDHIPHWHNMVTFMQVVAKDLGIELRVTYSKPNEISMSRIISTMLNSVEKPDYFLTGRWTKAIRSLVRLADRREIKTLTFNAAFIDEDREIIESPRKRLKYWIGELNPDDKVTGYKLADRLIRRAEQNRKPGDKGVIKIVAVGAYSGDSVSEARVAGLRQRVAEKGDAILLKVVLAGWRQQAAKEVILRAFEKYSDIDVVWAASDEMVLGVIDAAKQLNRVPGKDFVIGGFDWYPQNIDMIAKDEVLVSFGGQILDSAWALVLLYDYHHGYDFASTLGTTVSMPIYPVTAANVDEYKANLEHADWSKIDFRQFSKKYNPELKQYDFSLDAILQALKSDDSK